MDPTNNPTPSSKPDLDAGLDSNTVSGAAMDANSVSEPVTSADSNMPIETEDRKSVV